MINSRFTVAVHLLVMLTLGRRRFPGMAVTSELAAESVNTNPVVVRRILGSLRNVGMVSSHPGPRGGWFLERDPRQITLRDVYCAVEDEELFAMHHREPSRACAIGANIQQALKPFLQDAEAALAEKLAHHTIADVASAIESCIEERVAVPV